MLIDFHSHILPSIDDGAKNLNISLQMLDAERENNVSDVVLTPHFYLEQESPSEFLEKRQASFEKLSEAVKKGSYPNLHLGAEVLFTPSLGNVDLKPFCIGDTDYLLLELPYKKLSERFLNELNYFIDSVDAKIIIAHVERYLSFTDEESVISVMSMNVINQVNCASFLKMSMLRKKLIKWISSDMVHLLGSDAHNLINRPVKMKEAYDYISKKLPENRIMDNAMSILNNNDIT